MIGKIKIEKKTWKIVMTKMGEMVVKVRIGSHISSIMTPVGLITEGPSNKAVERARHSARKSLSATYTEGRILQEMP